MIAALERISAALMRTTEGSEALVRAVVEAAAEHLSADWVVFALTDGELAESRPRHLVLGPDRAEWTDVRAVPEQVRAHLLAVVRGAAGRRRGARRGGAPAARARARAAVRAAVGAFVAWTPPDREIDDTDRSVLHILAGQTAAALQNCALLDHSARLLARTTRQAEDLSRRHAELQATQAELGAARQREVLDSERHRIARELHDSVTQYALSAGMHIELARTEVADVRLRAHLDTAKDLTRRAVEQLRSAIYALHHGESEAEEDLPSMLRRLSAVHMPDELRVEVRIGGEPVRAARGVRAVAVPGGGRGAVQHGGARRREPGGGAAGLRRRPGAADDRRRRAWTARGGAAQPAGGERGVPVGRAPRAGEHGGAGTRAGRDAELPAGPAGWVAGAGRHPDPRGGAMKSFGTASQSAPAGPRPRPVPTRIVLVDDHAIMRQGLRAVLEREPDLHVVGEAGTPADAVAAVAAARPHVVLLDLKLTAGPQTDGLDVCRRLCALHPGIGVLVLTTFAEDRLVVESVQAGARGYVVKDVDTTELVRAIRAVSRGESAFDAHSASAMVRSLAGGVPEREGLTERELDVLRLLARGLSNRAIGAELFISETTVKFHVGNLMRKLMVSRRAEAVYTATKLGLL